VLVSRLLDDVLLFATVLCENCSRSTGPCWPGYARARSKRNLVSSPTGNSVLAVGVRPIRSTRPESPEKTLDSGGCLPIKAQRFYTRRRHSLQPLYLYLPEQGARRTTGTSPFRRRQNGKPPSSPAPSVPSRAGHLAAPVDSCVGSICCNPSHDGWVVD
jgi:hypothetical protein